MVRPVLFHHDRNWTNIFWILVPIAGAIVLIVFLTQPSVTQQSIPEQVAETS